jgi:hypothetical protein
VNGKPHCQQPRDERHHQQNQRLQRVSKKGFHFANVIIAFPFWVEQTQDCVIP